MPTAVTAYVNIGSNIGDRHAHIERAVTAISEIAEGAVRRSDPIESEPWGYVSEHPYINLGIAFETSLPPAELNATLQTIQHDIDPAPHRQPGGTYADRRIDIDLIAVDEAVINTPELTLPHPRMHRRQFVLLPMLQLAPEWRHPIYGVTPARLLARLKN